ncbi:MAG TPA: DUF3106 domain-containing protein [Polyangiaceae bacterium]|nr:DUF3106 domain-containing protein [Polyangiaceae bacterium]
MTHRYRTRTVRTLCALGLLAATVGLVQVLTHEPNYREHGASPAAALVVSESASAVDAAAVAQTGAGIPDGPWARLSDAQRQALAPLKQAWPKLDESRRRRWLAIASNFHSKTRATQDRIHARMTQWSELSELQRAEARLRYLQAAKLNSEAKRQRWEAYRKTEPGQRRPLLAARQSEVVPPVSVKAPQGATTLLMPPLAERTHVASTGSD